MTFLCEFLRISVRRLAGATITLTLKAIELESGREKESGKEGELNRLEREGLRNCLFILDSRAIRCKSETCMFYYTVILSRSRTIQCARIFISLFRIPKLSS